MSELRSELFDDVPAHRRRVTIPACATVNGTMLLAEVTNLSIEGARVAVESALAVGQTLTLHLPDGHDVEATVRWARDGAIGLHFVSNVEPWQLERVEAMAYR